MHRSRWKIKLLIYKRSWPSRCKTSRKREGMLTRPFSSIAWSKRPLNTALLPHQPQHPTLSHLSQEANVSHLRLLRPNGLIAGWKRTNGLISPQSRDYLTCGLLWDEKLGSAGNFWQFSTADRGRLRPLTKSFVRRTRAWAHLSGARPCRVVADN